MADIVLSIPCAGATLSDSALIELQRGDTEVHLKLQTTGLGTYPPTMTAANAPSPYVASASHEYDGSLVAWKAFDNNATTAWVSTQNACWLKIDMGVGRTCKQYSITARNAANQYIKTWTLQGSNDDANWTVLDTQTNITFTAGELKTFVANSTAHYRYYKLDITAWGDYPACEQFTINSYGYDTNSPTATLTEIDSGNAATVWDMSTIYDTENLASEAGSIKYKYSCHNTTGTPSWSSTWQTLAELQAETDPTGQYFQLQTQHISDGTQDASFADSRITASIGVDVPDVADVRLGTTYGAYTGTLDLPAVADVRSGTTFDNATKTGTLESSGGIPAINVGYGKMLDRKRDKEFDYALATGIQIGMTIPK